MALEKSYLLRALTELFSAHAVESTAFHTPQPRQTLAWTPERCGLNCSTLPQTVRSRNSGPCSIRLSNKAGVHASFYLIRGPSDRPQAAPAQAPLRHAPSARTSPNSTQYCQLKADLVYGLRSKLDSVGTDENTAEVHGMQDGKSILVEIKGSEGSYILWVNTERGAREKKKKWRCEMLEPVHVLLVENKELL